MKALVIESPGVAGIKDIPYPKPLPHEVTIQVERTGICGTDIHIFHGEFGPQFPVVPGHEIAGRIHEIGEGVTGLKAGDRVSVDPSIYCGACEYCLSLRGNHCKHWAALGVTYNGGMAEFVKVPAGNVIKLPEHVTYEEGAFIEPVACVIHAMNRLEMPYGSRVLLFGAGAMGQQLIQCLVKGGASELVVVDVSEKKLELSLQMGASKCFLSHEADRVLAEAPYTDGFDIVIDATGIPSVIQKALQYMGPTAKYLQFGVAPEKAIIQISPYDFFHKDMSYIGSMSLNRTFIPAYRWIAEGRIDVKPLVSKLISLEETIDYLKGQRDPDWFKVQIKLAAD